MALHTQGEKTNSRRLHISLILGQAKERQDYNKVFKPHARHGSSTDYSNQALLDFRDLTHSSKHTVSHHKSRHTLDLGTQVRLGYTVQHWILL